MKDSKSLRRAVSKTVRRMPRSGIRDFFDIVNEMEDTISLGVGEPGFPSPWPIRDVSIYALERGATAYTSNLGLSELRTGIAEYVLEVFGVEYNPAEEILVTTGVSEGMDLAVRAITDPGDEIIFHEPCYVSYSPVIQFAHGVPISLETRRDEGFKLDLDRLAGLVTDRTKALILNYPNNPTGSILSKEDLFGIADLAQEYDFLVISDEIYGELTYEGTHQSLVSIPGMRERTILLHGFSKAWAMTGYRIGYACAPEELIHAMTTIHQYTMLCAPTIAQIAAVEALKRARRDVPDMLKKYQDNRNYMQSSFEEMGLDCTPPGGAFYAFPYVGSLGVTSKEFAIGLLEQERVAVVPGEAFGTCGEGHVRCSYSTSLENVKKAMERMARFVDSLRDSAGD